MASGSSPREGNPRRLVYRVRNAEGEWRSRDGDYYTRYGAVWATLSDLKHHANRTRGWRPLRKGDHVVEFEMVERRAFPVEEL